MRLRRSALLCVVFAALAQLSSGCYGCRPFLCRPIFPRLCWPHCYQPGGGMPMGGDPGCASCFSGPGPVGQGQVFTGSPLPIHYPTVQQMPQGSPMPTTGGAPK